MMIGERRRRRQRHGVEARQEFGIGCGARRDDRAFEQGVLGRTPRGFKHEVGSRLPKRLRRAVDQAALLGLDPNAQCIARDWPALGRGPLCSRSRCRPVTAVRGINLRSRVLSVTMSLRPWSTLSPKMRKAALSGGLSIVATTQRSLRNPGASMRGLAPHGQ
jgi:hypothetical protein